MAQSKQRWNGRPAGYAGQALTPRRGVSHVYPLISWGRFVWGREPPNAGGCPSGKVKKKEKHEEDIS